MTQHIHLIFLCAVAGFFPVLAPAVELSPLPYSDRHATISHTLADLGAKRLRSSWLSVSSNSLDDLTSLKPWLGMRLRPPNDPDGKAVVLAIMLISAGIYVLSHGVPVLNIWVLKGATSKVIGILMLVLGVCLAIHSLPLILSKAFDNPGIESKWRGAHEVDLF